MDKKEYARKQRKLRRDLKKATDKVLIIHGFVDKEGDPKGGISYQVGRGYKNYANKVWTCNKCLVMFKSGFFELPSITCYSKEEKEKKDRLENLQYELSRVFFDLGLMKVESLWNAINDL